MRRCWEPIRQGEGVSRTISGDSKGQRVLWRVFLRYLSSREERWRPRRALPFEKRRIGSGIVGFCTAYPTALHQSLRLVVAKSVNSVFAFGAKSSVHFLTPPFPTEPSSAAVSSFAALRMRHTPCGYCAGLRRGPRWGRQKERR